MTDLDKLIDAVERGVELDVFDEWGYWLDAFPLNQREKEAGDFESDNASNGRHAWKGSLDAAKALHEAMLPGWGWDVGMGNYNPVEAFVHFGVAGEDYKCKGATSTTPARAWLLAVLKAYRSMM